MVLGLRSRGKKGVPVSLAFDIALQEVKPWPSKSLPPLVMIQWQRGQKRTGGTKCVAPGKDRVTFNDSFRIPATLYMLADKKKGNPKFQKKCIVFSLFEVQADRITPRGQPLARAVLDLADYGTLDRRAMSSIPMAVARKEFSALGTPHISFTIAPDGKNAPAAPIAVDKVPSISSSSTSKVADEESQDSLIAALMSDDDDDIASFTDDEGSVPSTPASEAKSESPRPEPAHTPPPMEIPKQDLPEVRSERVQRILSSVAQSSPASSAAAAAASAYASKKIGASSRASSGDLSISSESDGLPSPASAKAPTISVPSTPSSVPEANAIHDGGTKKTSAGVEKTEINLKSSAPGLTVQNQSLQKAGKEKVANDSDWLQRGRNTSEATKGIDRRTEAADDRKKDTNVLQAARMKFAEGAGERNEKLERKAVEEARLRAANAEAKATAAEEKARLLEREMDNLRAELRDAAALELALYSVVAQHGSSSHKIHSPARRLARIYIHACKHSSQDRRASTARNCASGLVVAARACENDVSRLTFWWSNVVVLREMISQAFDITPSSAKLDRSASIAANGAETGEPAHGLEKQGSQKINLNGISNDWRETKTLTSILERIEAWIFGRIVECIWWQSLTPHMQASPEQMYPSSPTSAETSVVSRLKRSVRGLIATDFGDSRQGNLSIEIWKSAFLDALQRICPVRAGGHDCGCLRVVTKMIIEQCVARLDVAMFNAILRDLEENVPTDPISDPITELSVLPISPDGVSFSGGAQLKNVINTWSTWLLTLTGETAGDAAQEVVEKGHAHFTLLRAMSDLLMLPKDMLMDKSVRKEVCPALNLLLIRRILSKFVPDEFSPDPVPPSLLAALNAEISMERQRVGEADISASTVVMASAPPVVYFPPPPASICDLFVDTSDNARLSRSTSLIRKGHTSDDELEEIESPLSLLVDTSHGCADGSEPNELPLKDASAKRYRLLREVWS